MSGIYWWTLLELYPFAIIDSFLFIDLDKKSADAYYEMTSTKYNLDDSIINKWKLTEEYLGHINDSITYNQRLSIMKYAHLKVSVGLEDDEVHNEQYMISMNDAAKHVEEIIMNTAIESDHDQISNMKYGAFRFISRIF